MSPSPKPYPEPAGGKISDRLQMMKLVHGEREPWEALGHPEHGDKHKKDPTPKEWADARRRVAGSAPPLSGTIEEHVWCFASIDAWRRRQHERLRFLLVNNLLGGKALEEGEKLKRLHENREWRNRP